MIGEIYATFPEWVRGNAARRKQTTRSACSKDECDQKRDGTDCIKMIKAHETESLVSFAGED
jgi:hypothetical protein